MKEVYNTMLMGRLSCTTGFYSSAFGAAAHPIKRQVTYRILLGLLYINLAIKLPAGPGDRNSGQTK